MTQPALSITLRAKRPGFDLDVDVSAPAGLTVLFGASGSGKTSVVDAVAGLTRDVSGRITVGDHVLLDSAQGICLSAHERRIGYVFQDARLFPHLTVRRNLDYARRVTPPACGHRALRPRGRDAGHRTPSGPPHSAFVRR